MRLLIAFKIIHLKSVFMQIFHKIEINYGIANSISKLMYT